MTRETPAAGAAAMSGPLSRMLLQDVSRFVREHGLVLWLDKEGVYTEFVASLASAEQFTAFPVVQFRGSWLELLRALEPHTGSIDPRPLLVHLPGHTTDSVRTLPVYETYASGKNFPARRLDKLVTEVASGRVRPERLESLLTVSNLTFVQADNLLADEEAGVTDAFEASLRALPLTAALDDLLTNGVVAARCREAAARAAALDALGVRAGMSASWLEGIPESASAEDVAFAVAAHALCVEYTHDLRRLPLDSRLTPLAGMPKPLVEANRALASHLRERHEAFYIRTADEVEGWIPLERSGARAEDLGQIDTLRFEEDKVLDGALSALEDEQWQAVLNWSGPRRSGVGFWTRRDASRSGAWRLLDDAARLGAALQAAGPALDGISRIEDALDRYVSLGSAVDRAHRQLEQGRSALLFTSLPHYEKLRECLDQMRECWRTWADSWSRDVNAVARRTGFLPDSSVQQRTMFDQVVLPLTREPGCTAYFLVDALRFEMGVELADAFLTEAAADRGATQVTLSARLAELPTITAVGMNALVCSNDGGRLRPIVGASGIAGFRASEFQITSPDSRQRAVQARTGGATCPKLSLGEVVGRDVTSLKQAMARAKVVLIHSTEIDDAGESGVGLSVFAATLQRLAAAQRLLRDAGVRRFVITADHGFLLNDSETLVVQSHGRKIDPNRRHVLTSQPTDHPNEVRVAMADLAYDDVVDYHLVFPVTTAVFDQGKKDRSFVHGGPTLQERVIPVITVLHRGAPGADALRYAVRAVRAEGIAGMHCIRVAIDLIDQTGLPFGGAREVDLALRALDAPGAVVEVCQVRPATASHGGAVRVTTGGHVEVFFRIAGPGDRRVQVEVFHPSGVADVRAATVSDRFDVTIVREGSGKMIVEEGRGWLEALPEGPRRVFHHLSLHGSVNEAEVLQMVGGASPARRFALRFEEYAATAPFRVRIESSNGLKRYVKEGGD